MNRIDVGDLRGADHMRNVEVTLAAARRADTHRLVGEPHVQRIAVSLRIHRDRRDPQLLARANHPQRDLPAVSYKYFVEHDGCRLLLAARTHSEKRPAGLHRLSALPKKPPEFPPAF